MTNVPNQPICFCCGAPLDFGKERVGLRESCPQCGADVHVCRNCSHYDPLRYNECREPSAERVLDKEKANFCDYFVLGAASLPGVEGKEKVLKALEDLFKR